MDKSWMHKSRLSKDYELGVENFIKFGFSNTTSSYNSCPCLKCGNCEKHNRKGVRDHFYVNDQDVGSVKEMIEVAHEEYSKDPTGFEKLLIDAEKPLYEGCKKYTKLSTLVKLYNLKVRYGWSDTSFSELLETLKEILPTTNELPNSLYEAKKTLGALGMEYEKIHACPNNCCLYRKEFANAIECPECGQSRWKNVKDTNERRKQIPSKVIWYFPIIPRFKRLFRSIECAENLTWHSTERINDGKLWNPADSPAWKLVDMKWPDFGSELRNLRLALSADGVNPHGDMSSKYSCWPVVIVIYNLPPWLCMKRKYMMLSMLISGPKQPGDDIGIYLAPLIEDLKLLWESGVECYDAYREEPFNLRSVLLWTINDFPAYGNLSGCCVKGYKACPICGDNTNSIRLKYGKKMAYLGHRRFLARNHPYRRQKKSFNGKKELDTIPEPLSRADVYLKLKDLEFSRGKKNHKKRLINRSTLLDIPGKSKDGLNARRDLVDLKLRPELAPISSEKKIFIPPACYTLTKDEKRCVLKTLSEIKVPEVHIVREVKLCGPIYLRWMYPFERFMKVIKNSVRNRYRPEGCIAESYLIEEAVEFCTDFLSGVDPIGLGTRKSQDHLDTSNIGRPLSMGVPFKPQQELLHQAHQYVLENTVDVQPYTEYQLSLKVEMLEFQITYDGLLMTLILLLLDIVVMQSMDVAITHNLVIKNEVVLIDELGYVLVDLNRVGHKSYSFILASQAKQVFYVEDPSDVRWSVVLIPPQRDFEDRYNNDELGDTILQCEGIPNGMPDVDLNNDLDDNILTYVRADCEGTWIPT
ncbi:uncharacterized protein LOC116402909 [Cucumis sativus]|uniref:uncharacterized protein LOC116402909 n=1 Tax=Cucumis sativus TaxID=3659 RepID=UPI0012F4FAB3|nr:uncharacterized protein LOC116402909 [Cucumis sativus]